MKLHRWIVALVGFATLALLASPAKAQADQAVSPHGLPWTGSYRLELEPHLVLGTAPPGFGQGSGAGAGVRGSVVLLRNGILPGIDDSVALGFGLDYAHYKGSWTLLSGWRDKCLHYGAAAPDGTPLCTEITSDGGTYNYFFIPIVLQWSLGITHGFSVFIEPGASIYYLADHGLGVVPALYLGGRVRLSRHTALTFRLGYPTSALGISFVL